MSKRRPSEAATPDPPPVPKRGEVWWVKQNPAVPHDPHLPRPAVILSTNARNRTWDSVIVVPFSTGLKSYYPAFHKLVPMGEGGLPQDSHARCDLVSNIDKSCLDPRGPLGSALSDKFMWDIVKGVRAAIGDNPNL